MTALLTAIRPADRPAAAGPRPRPSPAASPIGPRPGGPTPRRAGESKGDPVPGYLGAGLLTLLVLFVVGKSARR